MKIACLLLVTLVASTMAMTFEEYVRTYNKPYVPNSKEWKLHKAIFAANVLKINQHNSDASQTYKKGINMFTDMTKAERSKFTGRKPQGLFEGLRQEPAPVFHKKVSDLPASVDWRTKGIVTPVKNQGGCGSCWAFASTETMESFAALSVDPPRQVILAPQQLVSCSKNPNKCGGTGGCGGSIAELAFDYVAEAGGMTTEKYYPYTGSDSPCVYSPTRTPPAISVTGHIKLPENNYTALMNAVATVGPMAVNVEADTWFGYSSGILPRTGCNQQSTDIDHVVQLVGYGTEAGKPYWLVRNSWGPGWGEAGYIRLERSDDGMPCNPDKSPADGTACEPYPKEVTVCGTCGVLYDSSYPTGVKIL